MEDGTPDCADEGLGPEVKDAHAPPDKGTPADQVSPRVLFLSGAVFLVLLAVIGVALYAHTRGLPTEAGWLILYTCIGLFAGVAFCLFTPGSTGEFTMKRLGIKLGGGAAIGAAFMVLGYQLATRCGEAPPHVVVEVENLSDVDYVPIVSRSRGVSNVHHVLEDKACLLVKFDERSTCGGFETKQWDPSAQAFRTVEYTVDRSGKLAKRHVPDPSSTVGGN